MANNFHLEGKRALVTGSSRGIGRGIALELARQGADLIVNYRGNADAAAETVAEIQKLGRQAVALQANVGNPDEVTILFKAIADQFGGLDILVLNAAAGRQGQASDMPLKTINLTLAVNVLGPWMCVEAAVPLMKARGGGRIVALSTPGSRFVLPNYAAIGTSKAALDVLVRYLAVELAPHKIVVNAIAPGMVLTDAVVGHLATDKMINYVLSKTPMGRAVSPQEVGYVTAFLCSENAEMICGQTINIDGGWLMQGM